MKGETTNSVPCSQQHEDGKQIAGAKDNGVTYCCPHSTCPEFVKGPANKPGSCFESGVFVKLVLNSPKQVSLEAMEGILKQSLREREAKYAIMEATPGMPFSYGEYAYRAVIRLTDGKGRLSMQARHQLTRGIYELDLGIEDPCLPRMLLNCVDGLFRWQSKWERCSTECSLIVGNADDVFKDAEAERRGLVPFCEDKCDDCGLCGLNTVRKTGKYNEAGEKKVALSTRKGMKGKV